MRAGIWPEQELRGEEGSEEREMGQNQVGNLGGQLLHVSRLPGWVPVSPNVPPPVMEHHGCWTLGAS